jgi:methylenetetrahydrofolate reductase (NADPH)
MPVTALKSAIGGRHETAPPVGARIATFLRGFSIEATQPNAADLAALKPVLPSGTPIYLSAVAGRPHSELIEAATRVRARGFEPVPHLAARDLSSHAALDDLMFRLTTWAGVRRVLVIAGDRDRAAGPFGSALDVIESGLLQRHGIAEIDVAGYPDGHPRLSPEVLVRAFAAKVEAAEHTGLGVGIVTQFAFDPAAILEWVRRLRDLGIEHPVRIGMAGPTDLSTLLRYARRCGVRASVLGLARQAGLIKHLLGVSTPDHIVRALADAQVDDRLGRVAAHFFSFGETAATARWAEAAASGRIVLDRADGFGVEAP